MLGPGGDQNENKTESMALALRKGNSLSGGNKWVNRCFDVGSAEKEKQ